MDPNVGKSRDKDKKPQVQIGPIGLWGIYKDGVTNTMRNITGNKDYQFGDMSKGMVNGM